MTVLQLGSVWILQNRWVRILAVAFIMHILEYIDRNNIAMAIPSMRETLNLSPSKIGFAAGCLSFTFVIMQIPSGWLAEHWSPKKIILISAILWAFVSLSTAFVTTGNELIVNRLAMGLVEGAETITIIVLVRNWFPRTERARALMIFLVSVPLASVISNVISGLILVRFGWQWMFAIEAMPSLIWAGIWQLAVSDRPEQANWLPKAVQTDLVARLRDEELQIKPLHGQKMQTHWRSTVALLAANNFLFLAAGTGVVIWLPSILKETGISISTVGALSSLTYIAGAVMMVICSISSDYFQERKWHIIFLNLLAGLFLLLVARSGQHSLLWTIICFTVINGALYGRYAVFWAMPSDLLPIRSVGIGIGVINAVGYLGTFFGPFLFGYFRTITSGFELALMSGAAALFVAGFALVPVRKAGRNAPVVASTLSPDAL